MKSRNTKVKAMHCCQQEDLQNVLIGVSFYSALWGNAKEIKIIFIFQDSPHFKDSGLLLVHISKRKKCDPF